jgi:hypothetical protein
MMMTTAPTMYTILFMSVPFTLAAAVPRSNRVTCPSRLRYPSWSAVSVRQGTQRARMDTALKKYVAARLR